ncbi:uncharacterized protein LOC135820209 [Sycon ciliatum]|uniref:uncharacterized protein LOC135820209 n=1 Tax=Sycon ciliatum TaxID=27933 RepID=UPI0031F7131D
MSTKYLVQPFYGKDGEDLEEFWAKFLVLATAKEWSDEDARMQHLPLYLQGDAFRVFSRMADSDKSKQAEVKKVLVSAFSVTPSRAYDLFKRRCLRVDESVDAYVADLQRYAALSGHKPGGTASKDPILIEQLIAGLQPEFGRQLRMSLAGQELTIPACLERVRALRASETDARYTSRFSQSVSASASTSSYSGGVHRPRSTVVCYNCNQPGHVQRNCPEFKKKQKPRFSGPVVCHFCGRPGHAKPACPERRKWREAKAAERVAAAGTSHSSSDKCLCAVSTEAAPLPRIYVYVESAKPDDWCRGEAMLDTGSARTLVSSGFIRAAKMCSQVSAVKQEKLLALDGEALPISGSISLTIRRLDGPVNLPPTRVVAFVVPELSVINADLLLGSDLVRAIGGVRLQYSESGDLRSVLFGPSPASDPEPVSSVVSDALQSPDQHPSRHVSVVQDGEGVTLSVEDGQIKWLAAEQCWQAAWRWKDDKPPTGRIGSGIGEYPRKLSDDQEKLFQHEVDSWIGNGWLIEHDEEVHGAPAAILPWLAVSQEHKPTTPVRPCLDYRALNRALVSQPGMDASVCGEKLREWRTHDANEYEMLDIRKAYLQVRMSPELLRYQCVKWRGKLYVMTRMAFGLSVAPKFMDVIVKWCTRDHDGVDNYVDDLYVPKPQTKAVADTLERYGLRTKPAEPANSARVLGLQLFTGQDGQTRWKRRDGVSLECGKLTKRGVFSWCGRLVSHYPVCSWLRPACSFLKRLACRDGGGWDDDVPNDVVTCCAELASRVQDEDPATGVWNASVNEQQLAVWCDASDVAYGIVAEVGGEVMEDKSWLRDADEKKHINIAELEAVIRGLSTAVEWNASNIRLVTDSKTVYGWVKSCLNNERRVKVSGLNEVLVRRRLNIIDDIVATAKLSVTIEWVPSQQNKADKLTRVPDLFIRCWKKSAKPDVVAAVSAPPKIVSAIVLQDILDAQKSDPVVVSVIESVRHGREISDPVFKKLKSQLSVSDDGYLYRSVKVPPNDVRVVPVVSQSLQQRVVCRAHAWVEVVPLVRHDGPSVAAAFVDPVGCMNPYSVGSTVMLRQGDRRQKRTAPYESGWTVDSVVSPSTVVIVRDTNGRHSVKTVNIDLIKPSSVSVPEYDDACASSSSDSDSDVPAQPLQVGGHRLRNRAGLVPPVRYRS